MAALHLECATCGIELPTGHGAPCPECGSTKRAQVAKLEPAVEIETALSAQWHKSRKETREHYQHHPVFFWITICLTFGPPFLGLIVGSWPGVLVGLLVGGVCWWAGPRAKTLVREIIEEIEHGPIA
jgi:hypothetical protein